MKMDAKKGVEKLQRFIANIDKAIDEGLADTANFARQEMKDNLNEYDFSVKPQALLSSINSQKIADKHYQISADGGYAVYTEFGTGVVGQKNPHPYLYCFCRFRRY